MRLRNVTFALGLVVVLALGAIPSAQAQVNTVNLSGNVLDPQGLAVNGAKVAVRNLATGVERNATSGENGRYDIVGLPPGNYSLKVEAEGFAPFTNSSITLTLGVPAEYSPQLQLKSAITEVTVTAAPELVEVSKTDVSQNISSVEITNLPINGRNYINFTLLTSTAARDDTPSIGAAPTSGLNFGGQRARSNEVSVDGADAVDHSVNGVRATVSQEAVQEFQVITSNYMPEYGRATGGVVNIVTKSGGNDVHGNVFGFLRHKSIQARNPFSVQGSFNPATETISLTPIKQPYTRVQAGATVGGPIKKDKTFYFFSYEITRRQETGFTNIGADNFQFLPTAVPTDLAPLIGTTPGLLTQPQVAFVTDTTQNIFQRATLFAAGRASSAVALFGNALPGAAFPSSGAPLPASFTGLSSLLGNYPTREATSLYSMKLDHNWNAKNSSFVRASVSPSLITGIQVNAENQNFGQNSGSRTSLQQTRDLSIVGQHATSLTDRVFNEFRFQYARRGLHYGFSPLPGGSNPAVNITGFAFFGREPFSTEDRIERRFQWTDNLTWTKGNHTFKFGGDVNYIQLRSSKAQIFELNFGGVYTFGGLSAGVLDSALPSFAPRFAQSAPGLNAVQAYGFGIPTSFIQGIGRSNRPFNDKVLGVFFQDSWKVNRKLTLNYGARYDIEWTPTFTPGTALNKAAEPFFGVVEGVPVDSNNIAPRFAIAYDPWGNGKTVIRAGYGLFYDDPALALSFLSTAEDGALSTLLEAAGGTPSTATLDNPLNFGALNASSIFQGLLTGAITGCSTATPQMCYQASQQRFDPLFANSLFNNQNFLTVNSGVGFPLPLLPFTIPVQKNFVHGYAQQGNLTIEREIAKDFKISASYNYTHGVHLDRTINLNVADPKLLVSNDGKAVAIGLVAIGADPRGLALPGPSQINTVCAGIGPAVNIPGGGSLAFPTALGTPAGILGVGFTGQNCGGTPVGFIGTPAVFNYFRPSGPNPSFAGLVGGYGNLVALAGAPGVGFPTGFFNGATPIPVPWSDVNPQSSSGNSVYHAFTFTLSKRFSNHFELLSSWTWAHAIDDSTDLSTLLNPQDNHFPNLERSNSDFDQRHRWITSAVYLSPSGRGTDSVWRKIFSDFTVAPIIEVASGRPYNVLIGSNPNLDFGTATNRPSVLPAGTSVPPGFPPAVTSPFVKGLEFIIPTRCVDSKGAPFADPTVPSPPFGCSGTLGRNAFNRPGFFDIDLRIARKFPITERWNLDVIAEGFNMLNRFNTGDVSPLCDPIGRACNAGQPTAALDPRQFQFALKLNW